MDKKIADIVKKASSKNDSFRKIPPSIHELFLTRDDWADFIVIESGSYQMEGDDYDDLTKYIQLMIAAQEFADYVYLTIQEKLPWLTLSKNSNGFSILYKMDKKVVYDLNLFKYAEPLQALFFDEGEVDVKIEIVHKGIIFLRYSAITINEKPFQRILQRSNDGLIFSLEVAKARQLMENEGFVNLDRQKDYTLVRVSIPFVLENSFDQASFMNTDIFDEIYSNAFLYEALLLKIQMLNAFVISRIQE